MHTAIVHLIPVFAAEKSKTPFYIAGGLLVGWALILSLVIGMRSVSFPSSVGAERAVMLISAVLVLATVSMAVATSGGSTDESAKAQTSGSAETATTSTETGGGETAGTETGGAQPVAKHHAAAHKAAAPESSTLQEAADPAGQLSFVTKSLSAKAGKVTIDFSNQSPVPHNLTIGQGSKVLGGTPTFQGAKKTLTLTLKPGTYTFFCTVPGHRAAGMEGTLTVQ